MRFLAARLAGLVLVVVGITLVTFVTLHVFPADPARLLAGPGATDSQLQQIRRDLGLDQPLPVQYVRYLADLSTGNSCMSPSRSHSASWPLSAAERFPICSFASYP
jgi:ABC-type dipeptide/oligopeptide/nickel transport system permease component